MGLKASLSQSLERWLPCCWTPFELLNYFGVVYTFLVVTALLAINGHFTCPLLYGNEGCQGPVTFGYFICIQILLNFFCFHLLRRRNSLSNILPGRLRADESTAEHTKFCFTCNEAVPRKSHHCSLCKYCVLRKDHHCFFVGGCVGFGNQRFFIVFLLWTTVGAFYGTLYTFRYLNKFYVPFWPFGWIDYIGPVAVKKWLLWQHCSLLDLGVCLIFSVGFASTIAAGGFFLSQLFFLLRGMTMDEYFKYRRTGTPIKTYELRASLNDRIRAVFGPYWLLNFIIPMPWVQNRLDPAFRQVLYECYLKEL